jgi:hypothetical protein
LYGGSGATASIGAGRRRQWRTWRQTRRCGLHTWRTGRQLQAAGAAGLVAALLPDAGAAGVSARPVAGSAQAITDAAIIAPNDRIVLSRGMIASNPEQRNIADIPLIPARNL